MEVLEGFQPIKDFAEDEDNFPDSSGDPSTKDLNQVIHQFLQVLVFLSDAGVFSNDISGVNVLIRRTGGKKSRIELKLCDFGLQC
jgi:serine/threonine protein kinase